MKSLTCTLIALFGFLLLQAQPPDRPGRMDRPDPKMEKRVESMRIAFITNELELTPEESQAFWPVFNEMKAREKALREEMRPRKPFEEMSDEEAEALLDNQMKMEEREAAIRREYTEKFRKILPASKVVRLQQAEGEFRRRLVNEVKERRQRKERPGRRD